MNESEYLTWLRGEISASEWDDFAKYVRQNLANTEIPQSVSEEIIAHISLSESRIAETESLAQVILELDSRITLSSILPAAVSPDAHQRLS